MSNTVEAPHPGRRPGQVRESRPDIHLPNGEILRTRVRFAHGNINVCEKTVARMDLPTTYIGGVAYVALNASLKIVGDKVRRRNEPPKRRRAR